MTTLGKKIWANRKNPLGMLGKHHSEKTKRKIRELQIKNPSRGMTGKKHSEETIKKLKNYRGNKHYNWKGGITPYRIKLRHSEEYKKWRKDVFERDHYTCVICGQVGGKINAHHIKSFTKYPELRFDVNNGITICLKCHYIGRKETPLFFL